MPVVVGRMRAGRTAIVSRPLTTVILLDKSIRLGKVDDREYGERGIVQPKSLILL